MGCSKSQRFSEEALSLELPNSYLSKASGESFNVDGWLTDMNDKVLTELVEEAYGNNLDIKLTLSRLEASEILAGQSSANLYPEMNLKSSYSKSLSVVEGDGMLSKVLSRSYGLSTTLSWELDLWGRLKALKNSADLEADASRNDLKSFRLSLAGNIAKAWFGLQLAKIQFELDQENENSFIDSYKIISERYKMGISSSLDFNLILSSIAEAKEQRVESEKKVRDACRNLEVLLGRYPKAVIRAKGGLPEISFPISYGLPCDLLKRRPDIYASRQRVLAADKSTEAAEKARLPQLNLTANYGTSSSNLSNLLNANRLAWDYAGEFIGTIFDGDRKQLQVDLAENNAKEAWLEYEKNVLNALHEVEESLDNEINLIERRKIIIKSLEVSKNAELLAWNSYLAGDEEIITVLESHRRVLAAQKGLASLKATLLTNRINLYVAVAAQPFELD